MKKFKSRKNNDLDMIIMVLFLVIVLVFDKSTKPGDLGLTDSNDYIEVIEVDENEVVIIEKVDIYTENFTVDKDISEENSPYLYEVGELIIADIDDEKVHFIVISIDLENAYLRELGVKEGRELTIYNLKKQDNRYMQIE